MTTGQQELRTNRRTFAGKAVSTGARYREIVSILSRHGLGFLVDSVQEGRPAETAPEHVRLALEELGPTFVKLGQLLSTRGDLLPPEYVAELAKLQDAAPPVPAEAIRAVVAEELGSGVEEAFETFDLEPLAAASIGQAHAATLHDGTEVVVKVRRPGAVEQVEQDLEILRNLAARAVRHSQTAAEYDAVGLADEFARTLRAELDYLTEGRNADRFANNFEDEPSIRIPRLYWETTTSRVLTLERIRGIKVSDLDALDAAGIDRHAVAERATRATAKMVFDDGFFHADPHPGNFFVQDDGVIGVIDFGMVGSIDERLRGQLGEVLVAFTRGDADRLTDAVLELGVAQAAVDRAALSRDVGEFLQRYADVGVGEISLEQVIGEILAIVRRHRLRLPSDLALLLRVLVMDQGLAAALDPSFLVQDELVPYARRLVSQETAPEVLAQRLAQAGQDAAQLGVELPEQARRLLHTAEAGDLQVRLHADDLEPLATRVERVGNRLVAAVLVSSLVQAAAVVAGRRRRRQ
jgi:ubiquinone biosynthesis protein